MTSRLESIDQIVFDQALAWQDTPEQDVFLKRGNQSGVPRTSFGVSAHEAIPHR